MSLFFVYKGINILFLIFCIKSIPRLKCINAQWSTRDRNFMRAYVLYSIETLV